MIEQIKILLVDDDISLLDSLKIYFKEYCLTTFSDPIKACQELQETYYDIVITDYRMPDMSGVDLLIDAHKRRAYAYGILFTAYAEVEVLQHAINQNLVKKFVEKPLKFKRLKNVIDEAVLECQKNRKTEREVEFIKGENLELKKEVGLLKKKVIGLEQGLKTVFEKACSVAAYPVGVLLTGETGTGKEVFANLLHQLSPRKNHRFVSLNCSAIPENLLESELFGHTKGAFTGASSEKPGKIELADKGTLFLDEIGEMKPDLQAKLLRVLQEKKIERLGSNKSITVDFRLISATNKNLKELAERKKFREDLYYRLNTFPIHLPPLRERKEDMAALVRYFIEKGTQELGIEPLHLDNSILEKLYRYTWPGNVRELENATMRAVLSSLGQKSIPASAFDFLVPEAPKGSSSFEDAIKIIRDEVIEKRIDIKSVEKHILSSVLEYYDGNVTHAVQHTGILKDRFYRSKKR